MENCIDLLEKAKTTRISESKFDYGTVIEFMFNQDYDYWLKKIGTSDNDTDLEAAALSIFSFGFNHSEDKTEYENNYRHLQTTFKSTKIITTSAYNFVYEFYPSEGALKLASDCFKAKSEQNKGGVTFMLSSTDGVNEFTVDFRLVPVDRFSPKEVKYTIVPTHCGLREGVGNLKINGSIALWDNMVGVFDADSDKVATVLLTIDGLNNYPSKIEFFPGPGNIANGRGNIVYNGKNHDGIFYVTFPWKDEDKKDFGSYNRETDKLRYSCFVDERHPIGIRHIPNGNIALAYKDLFNFIATIIVLDGDKVRADVVLNSEKERFDIYLGNHNAFPCKCSLDELEFLSWDGNFYKVTYNQFV